MKHYTTPDQTAKLIELGFEKPKGLADAEPSSGKWVRPAYSIGELIEMLPQFMDFDDERWSLSIETDPFKANGTWWVFYAPSDYTESVELIDAIFAMIVKLKEERVI
jgi:hypothetical protein